ncbi:TolC family protein [Salmonella enterica]|nr:TolC family protein [Salmonella enterica]
MKKLLPILIGLSLSGFSTLSQAENLMQVYQQARLSNPELRKSAADRDAAFEKINEARSPLLPQLGLGADYTYSNGYRDANGINSNETSASLQLTQTLFDMSKWRGLTLQEKAAGIQDVTYQTDQQTLILNTANAYFKVLNAIDVLSYTQAQKEAIYRQLDQTTQSSLDAMEAGYSVGTRTIVDVLDATTTLYDAKQQLANARYTYLINQLNIKYALGTLNEQDLLALNSTLGKPIPTSPESVAPETPEQDAAADGYNAHSAAPAVQPTAARANSNNGNPFRH